MLCGLDPQPRLPKDITPATLAALSNMRKFPRRGTAEEEWQDIYQVLFPDDDRTVSPCELVPKRHSSPDIYSKS